MPLRLRVTDWVDDTRWRWLLEDGDGRFIADHDVRLDPASREYGGFRELGEYLQYHEPLATADEQLRTLGLWIGERVFGGLRPALRKAARKPAEAVSALIPQQAQGLLARPFEVACFEDGTRFSDAGIRFIYQSDGVPNAPAKPTGESLRMLAVFSLPARANPLNLRRERYLLQQRVELLNKARGLAVDLRVLQYGATRETLREALQEGAGWDVVHLSGHGERGELLLESEDGGTDSVDAQALGDLLALTRDQLKLLILDACYSGAASHASARRQIGLDLPGDVARADADGRGESALTPLPSLGFALAEQLECGVVAMRHPVGDTFATDLMLALYQKLLEKGQRLPGALQLAIEDARRTDFTHPPLSLTTPILLGTRAASLQLAPPKRPPGPISLPTGTLSIAFPREPERFVGRLQPMLRASHALAPQSNKRAVLFHGMPGAGKTACALELAYRHEQGRFARYVWYKAPEEGSDVATALFEFLYEIERQLNEPHLGLTTALDNPQHFQNYTLPRLRALLDQHSLLLVLDNLETLLTASNQWRVPVWHDLIDALITHDGPSRIVLTTRRAPAQLVDNPAVQIEPIHALSLAESVLLAHELPNLRRLFADAEGRLLLQRTIRVVQGHPKMLGLADALAADRAKLAARVAGAENEVETQGEVLDSFFAMGGTREGESSQTEQKFIDALQGWTAGTLGLVSQTARLLFAFLCRAEPGDRVFHIVLTNWKDYLKRLADQGHAPAQAALAEHEHGLAPAFEALRGAGLIEASRPHFDASDVARIVQSQAGQPGAPDVASVQQAFEHWAMHNTAYLIHPGVAECARAACEPLLLTAADVELANYYVTWVRHLIKNETEGGSEKLANAARSGVPYLMREQRWDEASILLDTLMSRDLGAEAVAFALPLLERLIAVSAGTESELVHSNVRSMALFRAGRADEAVRVARDVLVRARETGSYQVSSSTASQLVTMFQSMGHLDEALKLAEEQREDTRRAGLGPWTQLTDEGLRLQVLVKMGRYEEVLADVQRLRKEMETLPEESELPEIVRPWNVREGLLDTGRMAAVRNNQWELALELNEGVFNSKRARDAKVLELARTRFNEVGILLRLKRLDQARELLQKCRVVFEAEREVGSLGKIYSMLADIEDEAGGRDAAVDFQRLALTYQYQAAEAESRASGHHNLALYLARKGDADPAHVAAHAIAAGVIRLMTGSGLLDRTERALSTMLPDQVPSFAEVVALVEQVPGVSFAKFVERLPRWDGDGDGAVARVMKGATVFRDQFRDEMQRKQSVLDTMPADIQAIFQLDDSAFDGALRAALAVRPDAEAREILTRLREAGLTGGGHGLLRDSLLRDFEPLLQGFAAATAGEDAARVTMDQALAALEGKGYRIRQPIQRIWAGERDRARLTESLDATDALLVERVLELVSGAGPDDSAGGSK